MSLVPLQMAFAQDVAKLIAAAPSLGYDGVVGAEWERTPAQAQANAASGAGISHSLHIESLAIDLRAFRGGAYLTDSADYKALGDYWKSLHPNNCWGGDFHDATGKPKPDGNHFSRSPDGKRK